MKGNEMLVPAATTETPFVNSVTTTDFTWHKNPEDARDLGLNWSQADIHVPSVYVSDVSFLHSSFGDIDYQAEDTKNREQFKQLVPVLSHFFRPMDRPLHPDSDSSAEVAVWFVGPDIDNSDLNSIGFFTAYGTSRFPVELVNALDDLDNATVEAVEQGFSCPSGMALQNAKRLLRELYGFFPRRYEVYPTPDGEVAIDAPGEFGRSVVLLCDSEGGALCLVNMDGNHRRARYSTTEILPDGFVREALAELE